jgi:hypothetical protein
MSFEHERTSGEQDSSLYQITDSLLEAVRFAPSGIPETFGATPLNHAAAYDQQYSLRLSLEQLLVDDISEDVPQEIVEYMRDIFVSRFVSRGTANQENYLSSLKTKEELEDYYLLEDMITRAELGHATPSELLVVRQLLGIRSVELACLTHPYGKKIKQLLEPMRQAVRENVELLGGKYYEDPEVRYRVKGFVGEQHDYSKGLLMTRKRTIGKMPDGTTIRERSSFVLRLDDESVISKETIAEIVNAVKKLNRKSTAWQDEIVLVGKLNEIIEQLLGSDAFTLAIPISTTIYAFNLETAKLVKARANEERIARNNELKQDIEAHYPSLLEAIKAARQERAASKRPTKDIDGMLYVGREGEEDDDDSVLKSRPN